MGETKVKIVSAFFCSNAGFSPAGNVECKGIFTSFYAWAFPTSVRSSNVVVTMYGVEGGTSKIEGLICDNNDVQQKYAEIEVGDDVNKIGSTVILPFSYRFDRAGFYKLRFNVDGELSVFTLPILVTKKEWPEFSEKEIEFLRKNQLVPHSVRMNVVCVKCSRPYMFEENVIPGSSLSKGVSPFPESGTIECDECGHVLHLKDIQGQLRSSIKSSIETVLIGGK